MFLEIKGLLDHGELERLRRMAEQIKFVDGRLSNPANHTKITEQADMTTTLAAEVAQVVTAAFLRAPEFHSFAFPKIVAPPVLARYQPGMKYGAHYDAPFFRSDSGQSLRSDISATVFLSEPDAYLGGELVVHQGARTTAFKLAAGGAVLYPSTTLHEVAPVTSGVRLVAITFIQSFIPDLADRQTLYDVSEVLALEGLNMNWENRMRLEGVRANLMRRWSMA